MLPASQSGQAQSLFVNGSCRLRQWGDIQRTAVFVVRTQQAIHGRINEAIVKPLDPADDAFKLESQTFCNGAAASVLRGALDGDAIQFPRSEAVSDHYPATCRHDSLSLMRLIQPIAHRRPVVCAIHIEIADHSAKSSFEPNAGMTRLFVRIELLPGGDGSFDRSRRTQVVHPRVPAPQMLPISLKEFEQFPAVLNVNQPQLRLFVNGVAKSVFGQDHRAMQIRPPMEGRFAHLLSGDIRVPHSLCDPAFCRHTSIIGRNWRDFRENPSWFQMRLNFRLNFPLKSFTD
jgi:hypothetical protein